MSVTDCTNERQTHRTRRHIRASPRAIYNAFLTSERITKWMPPEGAVGQVLTLEPREGGRLRMVLTFAKATGKTSPDTDLVEAKFIRLRRDEQIVLAVSFGSDRPEFAGTMVMTWSFTPTAGGTDVSIVAKDVPEGIDRDDHERGMESTLAKLASFVELGNS